jgi:diguanylate cyclase (GGDEF)-like protein
MDVDNFKSINDTFGHHAGDIVLKELGMLLSSSSRASDIACRQGGDEFVVVLPGASNSDAIKRAEDWRIAFAAKTFVFQDRPYSTTLSLGVATYPMNANSANGVLQAADEALYRSKKQNNVVMASLRSSTLARKQGGQPDKPGGSIE